jgi:hypothetical protein
MDFVGFPFKPFKFKNDIIYIKYKFVCDWTCIIQRLK